MENQIDVYRVIADETELKWFFDHVIQRPQVNESYSAVFVSRHKKLTKEQQEEIGLTRREAEFLATVTFKLRTVKEIGDSNGHNVWTFDNFIKTIRRLEVNKMAYTTAKGLPIPNSTLSTVFYVNPCDDMKVCAKFFEEYLGVTEAIAKAMLTGKDVTSNYQSYQWFGKAESTIKHLKANQKGSRYWLDFDVDIPKWFKENSYEYADDRGYRVTMTYVIYLRNLLESTFGKGNFVIVDTSGGYHILVKTSAIHSNPHDFCKSVERIYMAGLANGESPYLDEKGVCKFECIVNDSQIPGLPLPGTYQYGRPVTVVNKEDFD